MIKRSLEGVPVRLRDTLGLLAGLVVLMTGMRLVFWLAFRRTDAPLEASALLGSLATGCRFDLRLALLLVVPFPLLSRIPLLDPRRSAGARRFWAGHLALVTGLVVLLHGIDFGHYDYLQTRLEAASLRFLGDPWISLRMVWESYPVLRAAAGLAVFGWLAHAGIARWLARQARAREVSRRQRAGWVTAAVVLFLAGLHGKVSYYPLRWSDAFSSPHHLSSHLALNPVLFFFDTLCTGEGDLHDRERLEAHYARLADYLGLDDPDLETLSFERRVRPTPLLTGTPNVVVVLMESFAAHSTGVFGNPLDPSPHFDRLASAGMLWRNFYTPRFGTARAVFCLITGIPDVTTRRTASRNPRIVDQRTIIDEIEGYEKHYFLGGSANWANIRGLLAHNIEGLVIHEEGSYPDAPRTDVWGLSDLHLFEQANQVLREAERPFLAVIHLSGNHPPYSIPEDDRGFELREVEAQDLQRGGFASLAEFNSFRFLDHSLGFYLDLARTEAYFPDTLFFLLGDNGTMGLAPHQPDQDQRHGLRGYHTPFLIYAAGLADQGRVFDDAATQMDVMATVAGAIGCEVANTTLGRNLLDPRFERFAFIQSQRGVVPQVGVLGRGLYARADVDGSNRMLHTYAQGAAPVEPRDPAATQLETTDLALALYHAAGWLLYHNRGTRADR